MKTIKVLVTIFVACILGIWITRIIVSMDSTDSKLLMSVEKPSAVLAATKADDEDKGRNYYLVTIDELINKKVSQTHIQVKGVVLRSGHEGDGDRHIDVCDSSSVKHFDKKHCMVFECIPKLMCDAPKVGTCIFGHGIRRYDDHHEWPEIHPVEGWIPCTQ